LLHDLKRGVQWIASGLKQCSDELPTNSYAIMLNACKAIDPSTRHESRLAAPTLFGTS
jgi:hypothetical protein